MGDAVNLASRLEAMTRSLKRPIVISANIAAELPESSVNSLGSHIIKGKEDAVPMYSIATCQECLYENITLQLNLHVHEVG